MARRNSPMVVPSRPRRALPQLPPVVPEITHGPAPKLPEPRGSNPHRIREVVCLTRPALHVEGEHALNFITDTGAILDDPGPHATIRERRFLSQALVDFPRPDPFNPGAQFLAMTDRQWALWDRLRGQFLLTARTSPRRRPAGPLSIPLPEASA